MKDTEAKEAAAQGEAKQSGGAFGILGLIVTLLKIFGVLEILKRLLSTFFGDGAVKMLDTVTDGAELTAVLSSFGIEPEQGAKMIKMLIDYMKEKVSPEKVEELAEMVPSLKAFLDDTKKEE